MSSTHLSKLDHIIAHSTKEAAQAAALLESEFVKEFIEKATCLCVSAYKKNKKILAAGNGGSLCDANHLVEELTGQFRAKRPALAAIALSDAGHMSCVANDMGFDEVFSRGVEALGQPGDLLILLTTSGNSYNLLRALEQAKHQSMQVIALLGKSGGKLKGLADLELVIDGFPFSDRIQEVHMAVLHILVECIEEELFSK